MRKAVVTDIIKVTMNEQNKEVITEALNRINAEHHAYCIANNKPDSAQYSVPVVREAITALADEYNENENSDAAEIVDTLHEKVIEYYNVLVGAKMARAKTTRQAYTIATTADETNKAQAVTIMADLEVDAKIKTEKAATVMAEVKTAVKALNKPTEPTKPETSKDTTTEQKPRKSPKKGKSDGIATADKRKAASKAADNKKPTEPKAEPKAKAKRTPKAKPETVTA